MPDKRIRDYAGSPPFAQPVLQALDRLEQRETLVPGHLERRARALLQERFGDSSQEIVTSFAGSVIGIHAEHTHYIDGFGVLLPLPEGTAVAARRSTASSSHVAFEGLEHTWMFGDSQDPVVDEGPAAWACIFERAMRRTAPRGEALDVAVVSTVLPSCASAYRSSLAVAVGRAGRALRGGQTTDEQPQAAAARSIITACTGEPFGAAYPLATIPMPSENLALVDAHAGEYLPLTAPPRDEVAFALIDLGEPPALEPSRSVDRSRQCARALRILQENGFPELISLRQIEHRQLQRVLEVLPDELVPVVRYLVGENRRVYRHIAAVRHQDWQLMGALMLMSHAAQRDDWQASSARADFVVGIVEEMSAEGMHGACLVDHGSCVLLAGRPVLIPECLDRVCRALKDRFGRTPSTILL